MTQTHKPSLRPRSGRSKNQPAAEAQGNETLERVSSEGLRRGPSVIPGIDETWYLDTQAKVPDPLLVRAAHASWKGTIGRFIGKKPQLPDQTRGTEAEEAGEWAPYAGGGAKLRTKPGKAKRGWYAPSEPGSPSTTRQADVLNPALIAAPTGIDGVIGGRDVLSRTGIFDDPITGYNASPRRVTSTNVLVGGDVGAGKSSFTKTVYALRPVILRGRRAVIFDKKSEFNPDLGLWEGEYSSIVRFFTPQELKDVGKSWHPIRCALDGSGVKLNLFDPAITGQRTDSGGSQIMGFLNNLVLTLRPELDHTTSRERRAIRLAYQGMQTALEGLRAPTPADLHRHLGQIDRNHPDLRHAPGAELDRLEEAGWAMRHVFNELLENYGRIFDGETSPEVRLSETVTSFDISSLPEHGPAIPLVMGLANLWLLGMVRRTPGVKTNVIIEEAWHILSTAMAQVQQSNIKLSRSLGLSNIYNIHKLRDIPEGSAGMAVFEEAQTVHLFRIHKPEIAAWTAQKLGLNEENVPALSKLANGQYFRKTGSAPEILVEHIRSRWEVAMTDTDGGLRTTAA
ncbi:MAG: ATP/GTP-binding protein [Renibacterium salmoninarum]|jgi:hypothetical protein|uniref:ATP/GTP-binding protein n=1 Tax=Arthrobacter russicus TaxID=172040 RepID=UPI002653A38F|nr:ATP/GTP-binding protein [Renibacterium salmoninarum]